MVQFRQDGMTRQERWAALLNRQPVDMVTLDVMAFAFSAAMVGCSKVDVYADPEKAFWAELRTQEMFGACERIFYHGGAFPAREFGGEVKMPTSEYDMAVSLLRPPVQTEDDVWKLEVPDLKTAGTLPLIMRFSQLQAENGVPITFPCGGILSRVGGITGVEKICRWIIKKPELVHRLCRIITDLFMAMAEYWVATFGPENLIPCAGAPTESNQIISPKQFAEFCLPYYKELYGKLLALGIEHIHTHICGEQNLNLPYWAQVPMGDPGIVSFGHEVDLETASRYFPNDIIQGNVEPAVIQTGTPAEVYELSRLCIEKGKKHRAGFILNAGCELPAKAPPYNVWMMRKAIDDFGWYE